jgi:two-component system response regulator YesN
MPRFSGLETLKQIRKTDPNIFVVMLTGQSSKDTAIEALKGQANDYIEKPFEVERLLTIIRKMLEGKNQAVVGRINKMDRVKIFLERNVDKKISLKQAAVEVCLSPKYLSRLFKEYTGVGFNEYRLQIKIQKAEGLLGSCTDTIEQLSIRLGYKNPESFIRIFQKRTGLTPTQYRLKQKDKRKIRL